MLAPKQLPNLFFIMVRYLHIQKFFYLLFYICSFSSSLSWLDMAISEYSSIIYAIFAPFLVLVADISRLLSNL
jgi:hypothetical protein